MDIECKQTCLHCGCSIPGTTHICIECSRKILLDAYRVIPDPYGAGWAIEYTGKAIIHGLERALEITDILNVYGSK